jgi:hypothetical protein
MVRVNKIHWLSEDANEAEVYLFDGNFNIIAFSHPFRQNIGDVVEVPLNTLNAKEVYILNDIKTFSVERKEETFEYRISGQIINKELNHILVGDFVIQLDIPLPNDLIIGDYIFFSCDRLDLY